MKYVWSIVILGCLFSSVSVSAAKEAQYTLTQEEAFELAKAKASAKEANTNVKAISQKALSRVDSELLSKMQNDELNLKNAKKALKSSKDKVISSIEAAEKSQIQEAKITAKEAREKVKSMNLSLTCKYGM